MIKYSNRRINRIFTAALVLLALATPKVQATGVNVGTFGKTYPVAERDFVEEMTEIGNNFDSKSFFSEDKLQKMVENYRPKDWVRLPKATEESVWLSDLTYELEFDISNVSGKVVYPKGYRINPLDYGFDPSTMVFIDGEDAAQVRWFQDSKYANDPNVELYLTWGSAYKMEKAMRHKLYYASAVMTKRLQLKAVPCVVAQKGNMMEVHEYAIDKIKSSK